MPNTYSTNSTAGPVRAAWHTADTAWHNALECPRRMETPG
jgi:hypothetical protein